MNRTDGSFCVYDEEAQNLLTEMDRKDGNLGAHFFFRMEASIVPPRCRNPRSTCILAETTDGKSIDRR